MTTARKPGLRAVPKAAAPLYQLRIDLHYLKPAIWRRIVVPGSIKLSKLHVVLLWGMGWQGGHLHAFTIGDTEYGEPDPDYPMSPPVEREDRTTLARALGPHTTFTYLYDFGDSWEHRVKVEKILPADPTLESPLCLAGANACPPEDVGGAPGYIEFLEAITDPKHEEHEAMLQWSGGRFDPTAFNIDEANARLSEIKL
jgi:hypothetical protein